LRGDANGSAQGAGPMTGSGVIRPRRSEMADYAIANPPYGLTLLLFYMHRDNIRRLQAGTEGRIGEK
jgi:glycerol-3-phosphate acyltransferase PlsY